MIETYRNMKMIYTSNTGYAEDILHQDGIMTTLYIDKHLGKAVFTDKNDTKTVLERLESIDIKEVSEAIQITITEADGILWVFSRRKK